MNQVLKELATDEEVENAFRDRHSSITDSNQTIELEVMVACSVLLFLWMRTDLSRHLQVCKLFVTRLDALCLFRVPRTVRANKIKAAFEAGEKVDLDNFVGNMGDSGLDVVATLLKHIFENFPIRCFRSRAIADHLKSARGTQRWWACETLARYFEHPLEVPKIICNDVYCDSSLHHSKSRHQQDDTGEHSFVSHLVIKAPETSTPVDPMAMMDETQRRECVQHILRNRETIFNLL